MRGAAKQPSGQRKTPKYLNRIVRCVKRSPEKGVRCLRKDGRETRLGRLCSRSGVRVRVDAIGAFECLFGLNNQRKILRFRVFLDPLLLVFRDVGIWIDGFHGAFRNTEVTVYAGVWIDVQPIVRFVERFHGAYCGAVRVVIV